MAETRMILKGGEQEIDLLEKATSYYNSILPKYWEKKENNTIDLILRHPQKEDGFSLPDKEEYEIDDILKTLEKHRQRQYNKQKDYSNPQYKDEFWSAYADYVAKRDSEIIINSKKENDMENITPKQEQNTNMIGGTIREIAGKSLSDKNYLYLFDEGTKNTIDAYLKTKPNIEPIKLTPQDNLALAERWQQEINNPTEMSKGMTINQIAEKEANYHSLYNHGIKQTQNLHNMNNTQEINKEKINSFVNDVIFTQKNETEQEHTERYTQKWNELSGDEKAYVKEKGADIAVSSIGEAYYEDIFMPREKENEIIADFNSKIEKLSAEEVVTKKHNEPRKEFDIIEHLNNQMKYLGFGDNHKEEIQKGIDSNDKSFQIKTTSDRVMEGNQVDFAVNFNQSEKGGVFLNSFDARLITQDGEERSHNFKLNFTAKEAINLLEGRAVKTEFTNSKTNEPFEAFVRLKFNEPKNEYDNYKLEFHKANEIDTAKIVELSGLKFEKPEYKDFVVKSLEKGNITNVKFTHEGNEIEGKAVLNPQYKNLNLYDKDMNRLNTNKPLQGLEQDNSHEKNNVRQQNISRSI